MLQDTMNKKKIAFLLNKYIKSFREKVAFKTRMLDCSRNQPDFSTDLSQ